MKAIGFQRVRDVTFPTKGHNTDAGIDFYIPNDMTWESFTIAPNNHLLIPSGIKVNLPDNYMLLALEKSGVATKTGLVIGARVVDAGYEGEIHIHMVNPTNKSVTVTRGQKIVQFVIVPVVTAIPYEVDQNQYELFGKSSRGDKGFGSTGL